MRNFCAWRDYMIGIFNIGGFEINSVLAFKRGSLDEDQFVYYIGWFKNEEDTVLPEDYTSVATGLGFTVSQDSAILGGNYAFMVGPWTYSTEALARAAALSSIDDMVAGLILLDY